MKRTRGFRYVLGLGLLTLLLTPAAASEFPISSVGDIWFQADHAGFRLENGQILEEYYFRVTNNQLQFQVDEEGKLRGRVFVHLRFRNEEDEELSKAGHQFEFTVTEEQQGSADHSQLFLLREALDPRTRTISFEMEDLNARKRGLLYLVTGKRKNGKAEGEIALPPFYKSDFGMSDVQLAWKVQPEEENASFVKNGFSVTPNPSRSFGLLQPRLSAYYEVYDLREATGPRTYLVDHEIMDPQGVVVHSDRDTVRSDSGEWVKVFTHDLSAMQHGEGTIRITVSDPRDEHARSESERPFNLLWQNEFWAKTEQEILDEARVLYTEEEYERFREMSAGDRELYLQEFWGEVDPSPMTAGNEVRDEFLRRVEYANLHFSAGGKGMISDRGRIHIRFGAPDEIERELLPTLDRQLDQLVGDLEQENAAGRTLATNDEFDTRPFEIWTYTRQGAPLFPERERATSVTGLRFIFVDETGTGYWVLRYSSDFIGF